MDLPEARAMEPARFGRGDSWGWGSVVVVISVVVGWGSGFRPLLDEEELDLNAGFAVDGWRLCGLLELVLELVLLLTWGTLLRLRPRRYSSAGLRMIPDPAPTTSAHVPSREDIVPVTGSQRRFSIKIGLER